MLSHAGGARLPHDARAQTGDPRRLHLSNQQPYGAAGQRITLRASGRQWTPPLDAPLDAPLRRALISGLPLGVTALT